MWRMVSLNLACLSKSRAEEKIPRETEASPSEVQVGASIAIREGGTTR